MNSFQSKDVDASKDAGTSIEHYKFTVSYDGTHYQGFQIQNQERTVQRELEIALRCLGWNEASIIGAGRTDSGVHAEGQVFSASLAWRHGNEVLLRALNAKLPKDITIREVELVPQNFHARFDAKDRCYHYHIYQAQLRDSFRDRFCWRVWPTLNRETLDSAAKVLIGRHDFRAFGSPPRKDRGTVREVYESYWCEKEDGELMYVIRANAFLYHMVRHIVFTQVNCAQNVITLQEIEEAVERGTDAVQGLAPPNGLRLYEVRY